MFDIFEESRALLPELLENNKEKREKILRKIENSKNFASYIFDNIIQPREKIILLFSSFMLIINSIFTVLFFVQPWATNYDDNEGDSGFYSYYILLALIILQLLFFLMLKKISMPKLFRYKLVRIVNFLLFYFSLLLIIYNLDNINKISNLVSIIDSKNNKDNNYSNQINKNEVNRTFGMGLLYEIKGNECNYYSHSTNKSFELEDQILIVDSNRNFTLKWNLVFTSKNFSSPEFSKIEEFTLFTIFLKLNIFNYVGVFYQNLVVIFIFHSFIFICGLITFNFSWIVNIIASCFNMIFFLFILQYWSYYECWGLLVSNAFVASLASKLMDLHFLSKRMKLKYEHFITLIIKNQENYIRIIGGKSIVFKNNFQKTILINSFHPGLYSNYKNTGKIDTNNISDNQELNKNIGCLEKLNYNNSIIDNKNNNNNNNNNKNNSHDKSINSAMILRSNTMHNSKVKSKFTLNELLKISDDVKHNCEKSKNNFNGGINNGDYKCNSTLQEKELFFEKDLLGLNINKCIISDLSLDKIKKDGGIEKQINNNSNFRATNNHTQNIHNNLSNYNNIYQKSFHSIDSKHFSRQKSKFYENIENNLISTKKQMRQINSFCENYNNTNNVNNKAEHPAIYTSQPKSGKLQIKDFLFDDFRNTNITNNNIKDHVGQDSLYEINYFDIEFLKHFIEFSLEDFDLENELENFFILLREKKPYEATALARKKTNSINVREEIKEQKYSDNAIPRANKNNNLYEKLFFGSNLLNDYFNDYMKGVNDILINKKNNNKINPDKSIKKRKSTLNSTMLDDKGQSNISKEKFIGHYFDNNSFFNILQLNKKRNDKECNNNNKSTIYTSKSGRSNFLTDISTKKSEFPRVYSVYVKFLTKIQLEKKCNKIASRAKRKKASIFKQKHLKANVTQHKKYLIINSQDHIPEEAVENYTFQNKKKLKEINKFNFNSSSLNNTNCFNNIKNNNEYDIDNHNNNNINLNNSQKENFNLLRNIHLQNNEPEKANANLNLDISNNHDISNNNNFQQDTIINNLPISINNQSRNIYNINIDKLNIYDFGNKNSEVNQKRKSWNRRCLDCFKRKKNLKENKIQTTLKNSNSKAFVYKIQNLIQDQNEKAEIPCAGCNDKEKETWQLKRLDGYESGLNQSELNNSNLVLNRGKINLNCDPANQTLTEKLSEIDIEAFDKKTASEKFYCILIFKEIDKEFICQISEFNKNKDKKLSKLIHELKTPLNSIIGITIDTIENFNSQSQIENLNLLKDLSRYSTFLINDITQTLNWQLSDIYGVDIEEVNVLNVLEFSYNILKALLKCFDAKADLVFPLIEIDDAIKKFVYISDDIRLKQIILNFISNAVKFTKRGYIKITARIVKKLTPNKQGIHNFKQSNFSKHNSINSVKQTNSINIRNYHIAKEHVSPLRKSQSLLFNYLEISITDSGVGIEEKNKDKIFLSDNAMIQDKKNRNLNNKFGSGMGLNICYKLAKLLDHELTFDSKLGEGTTFKILLKCFQRRKSFFQEERSSLYPELSMNININNNTNNIHSSIKLSKINNDLYTRKPITHQLTQKTYTNKTNSSYNMQNPRRFLKSSLSRENSECSETYNQVSILPKRYQSVKTLNTKPYDYDLKGISISDFKKEKTIELKPLKIFSPDKTSKLLVFQNSYKDDVSSHANYTINNVNFKETNLTKFKLNILRNEDKEINNFLPYSELNDKSSKNNQDSERLNQTKIYIPDPLFNKNLNIYSIFKRKDSNSSHVKSKSSDVIDHIEQAAEASLNCPADDVNFFQKNILRKLFTIKNISSNENTYDFIPGSANVIPCNNNNINGHNNINNITNNYYNFSNRNNGLMNGILSSNNINTNSSIMSSNKVLKLRSNKFSLSKDNSFKNSQNKKSLVINNSKIEIENSLISSLVLYKENKTPKILIIDDQKYIRTSLKNILKQIFEIKKTHYDIIEGNDGLDILKHVIEDSRHCVNCIKIIFTDENMEYINGTKAIEVVRELEKTKKIINVNKFCIVSSNDENSNKKAFIKKGADFVINKPCNVNAVLSIINRLEENSNFYVNEK